MKILLCCKKTIKKVAKLLYDGKLVMWGQGWGEVGPRALGFRSILMNLVHLTQKIINDKVKKECGLDLMELVFLLIAIKIILI